VADGYVSERWLPVSPVTDELGAFVWKVPMESLGYGGPPAEPVALPAVIEAQPAPPRHSEPVPAPAPRPEPVAEPKPEPKPKPEPIKLAQPATMGDVQPRAAASTDAASSRQPDDPGPDQVPESDGWTRKLAGG
jgi:HemY protein